MTTNQTEAQRLAEEDERTSAILRMKPRYAPELRRLQAENEALRKDAERFNHLIDILPPGTYADHTVYDRDTWIEAIDAAKDTQ